MAWPTDNITTDAVDSGADSIGASRQTIHDTIVLLKAVVAEVPAGGDVWNSGNDGPSSGLSAQYLGGQDNLYYLNADNIGQGILNADRLPQIPAGKLAADSVDRQNISLAYQELSSSIAPTGITNVTTAGGLYSLSPSLGDTSVNGSLRASMKKVTYHSDLSFSNTDNVAHNVYISSQYLQASPPYSLHGYDVPLFIQAVVNKRTLEPTGISVSDDPVWANNGSHDLHRTGRYQQFIGGWGIRPSDIFKNEQAREYTKARKKLWLTLTDEEREVYLSKPWTAEEKNIDMNEISSSFHNINDDEMIVMIDSANDMLPDLFDLHRECSMSEGWDDGVMGIIQSGHLKFTEAVDLTGPSNVQMMRMVLK